MRLLCSIFLATYFLILNFPVFAAVEKGNSKAFKVKFHGHTSYILGTWHDFDTQNFQIPPHLIGLLDNVSEVILETDEFDASGTLKPEKDPDISLDKIVAFKPVQLRARPKAIAEEIFSQSELRDYFLRLNAGILHFFAFHFANILISENKLKAAKEFAVKSPNFIKKYDSMKFRRAHREAANSLLGTHLSDEEILLQAFDYFMNEENFRSTKSGIDSEIYRQAHQRGLMVSGLHRTEPYSDRLEEALALINDHEVNRSLVWLGQMIAETQAAQNWINVVFSNYLIGQLQSRFFEIDNKEMMRLTTLVTAHPVPIPGEERLKEYERNRHRYWVPQLIQKMRISPVLIAVGVGHVIGTHKSKNLLEYFRDHGAIVEPIFLCENLLKAND